MDNLQAGVAFLGFAKFEEFMALSMVNPEGGARDEHKPAIH
jgi:hypothetical protein